MLFCVNLRGWRIFRRVSDSEFQSPELKFFSSIRSPQKCSFLSLREKHFVNEYSTMILRASSNSWNLYQEKKRWIYAKMNFSSLSVFPANFPLPKNTTNWCFKRKFVGNVWMRFELIDRRHIIITILIAIQCISSRKVSQWKIEVFCLREDFLISSQSNSITDTLEITRWFYVF